jgi:hypothetical protein
VERCPIEKAIETRKEVSNRAITGLHMKKFTAYRILTAASAIIALVVASGAGNKFSF